MVPVSGVCKLFTVTTGIKGDVLHFGFGTHRNNSFFVLIPAALSNHLNVTRNSVLQPSHMTDGAAALFFLKSLIHSCNLHSGLERVAFIAVNNS